MGDCIPEIVQPGGERQQEPEFRVGATAGYTRQVTATPGDDHLINCLRPGMRHRAALRAVLEPSGGSQVVAAVCEKNKEGQGR